MVRDLLKKLDPTAIIDWAVKVGVAAAIGLYLVVKMVAILTVMVESNLDQGRANSVALVEIQRATSEIAAMTRMLEATNRVIVTSQKEQSAVSNSIQVATESAKVAATAAQKCSLLATDVAQETNNILRTSVKVQEKFAAGIVAFQAKVATEHSDMLKSQSLVLENQGKILDSATTIVRNQGKILDCLPTPQERAAPPAKP